jgi:flagellar hook-basal body complex protein FliE
MMALDPMQSIQGVERSGRVDGPGNTQGRKAVDGTEFKKFLQDNLNKVNQMQTDADEAVHGLLTGKETDITKVMGAVEKADVAFQTLMAVRNKLVESYQEVLRMRV